ncbi:MAG: dihydropteroate synthase [Chloroherpetonaceae bacterium]|nr:dihydropteroate synthase [Chloroherpetonaceae bacterium]
MKPNIGSDLLRLQCRDFVLDLRRPRVMAVLNLTPDSFSDGGRFYHAGKIDYDSVLETALQFEQEGADIIDIGGELTRPGAVPISAEEEMRRILPAVEQLSKRLSIPISVNTTKAVVAEAALQRGASIVNDISGFGRDTKMPEVCARYGAAAVIMHLPKRPETMQWSYHEKTAYKNLVAEVMQALAESIQQAERVGLTDVAIDVGFGFGKSVEDNYELLRRLREFKALSRPILVGLSRKSFIGKVISKR